MAACFFPIKILDASIRKSELRNNLNIFRTLLEAKKAKDKAKFEKYAKVRESIYEYFGIPHSTYLACSEKLKSKISRLYFEIAVFGR